MVTINSNVIRSQLAEMGLLKGGLCSDLQTLDSLLHSLSNGSPRRPPQQLKHIAVKFAFIAALHDCIEKVQTHSSFNLETAINDLWTKLNGVRSLEKAERASIDVESMNLCRIMAKRSGMFDMLRQIIDKYNETAKGVIQSMGR